VGKESLCSEAIAPNAGKKQTFSPFGYQTMEN